MYAFFLNIELELIFKSMPKQSKLVFFCCIIFVTMDFTYYYQIISTQMNISFQTRKNHSLLSNRLFNKSLIGRSNAENSMIQFATLKPSIVNIKKRDAEKLKETVPERSVRGSFIPSSETRVEPDHIWKIVGMMCVICLSPFYVGLTIFLSASASWNTLNNYYKIPLDPILGFSLINGVVPFGGMFGSMTLPYVMKYTTKRDIYFIFLAASAIFAGLTCMPFFEGLVVGRFLLGIICSWENSMGATLIRDLTPVQYRTLFGAFYLTSRVCGITSSFLVGLIFDYELTDAVLCVVNMLPAILALVQLILLRIFVPVVPADLIAKNKLDQLRTFFLNFYSEQKVDKAVNNCVREFKAPTKIFTYVNKNKTEQQKEEANKIFVKIQQKALFISLHACLLRQFCGVNYLTLYTTFVMQQLNFKYYLAGPVLINIVQIAATFAGLYICYKFPRKPLLLIGIAGAFAGSFIVAMCDYFQIYAGVLGGQIIYMIFIGSMVSPIAWPYPPELIPPLQVKYNSLISWTGSTIIAVVPIRNQSYQFFFAVSAYLFVCEIITYFLGIETKGQTLREVMTGFMKQAYTELSKIPVKPLPLENILPDEELHKKKPKQAPITSNEVLDLSQKRQEKVSLLDKKKQNSTIQLVATAAPPQIIEQAPSHAVQTIGRNFVDHQDSAPAPNPKLVS